MEGGQDPWNNTSVLLSYVFEYVGVILVQPLDVFLNVIVFLFT